MKANIKLIKKNRKFSVEFKKGIVEEFESGKLSVRQLSSLYGINFQLIYTWIYKFSEANKKGYQVVEKKDSISEKLKKKERKVKELESLVGIKQIRIEYLERLIRIAGEELSIDIEKNFDTPH